MTVIDSAKAFIIKSIRLLFEVVVWCPCLTTIKENIQATLMVAYLKFCTANYRKHYLLTLREFITPWGMLLSQRTSWRNPSLLSSTLLLSHYPVPTHEKKFRNTWTLVLAQETVRLPDFAAPGSDLRASLGTQRTTKNPYVSDAVESSHANMANR